jgi:hypothetical protein
VVSLAHQGSNPGARIYFWIYFRIYGDAYSVGGDVPIDDEVGRVCVHRDECMRVYMNACVCTVFKEKKEISYSPQDT